MITILIPSYNHEKFIIECLDAACQVDIPGKKIIVIDDGSTDNTTKKVQEFIHEKKSNDIELVCKKNSGLISSLNLGLNLAKTEYLYLVASDDIPVSPGIVQCVEALLESPSCQFCIGGGNNFSEDWGFHTTPIYGAKHEVFFKMGIKKRSKAMFLSCPSPMLLQSTVFKVKALQGIGGWDMRLMLDDYPTFIKLLEKFPQEGKNFIYRPEFIVIKYRHHGLNSYKNLARQFFMVRQTMEAMAPPELQSRAVGKALGQYMLLGLRVADFIGMYRMLKASSWMSRVYAFPAAVTLIINKTLSFLK